MPCKSEYKLLAEATGISIRENQSMADKTSKTRRSSNIQSDKSIRPLNSGIDRILFSAGSYLPWIIATVYTLYMAVLIFSYHRTGWFGVETDFYAELAVQAKKILAGSFSPVNYGPKGPAYSLILAGAYIIIRDFFTAGIIINLLSAFAFIISSYFLIEKVFNRLTSTVFIFILIFNYSFQNYTFQVGSDMPFMAFCALSMLFLFKYVTKTGLIISAVFGLAAFLTRYNGVFLIAGSMLYLLLDNESFKTRAIKSLIWLGVFFAAGLPWFIPNWIVWGSPFHNDNYYNVVMEFYGLAKSGFSYESWMENVPKEFRGIKDIVMYDPVFFFRHLSLNVARHFTADMLMLVKLPLCVFTVVGIIAAFFSKPGLKKLIFFSFGAVYFMILTIVFYNERFALFLLVFYISIAVWPWTEKIQSVKFKKAGIILLSLITAATAFSAIATTYTIVKEVSNPQPLVEELKDLGLSLGKIESDKSKKIIARVPHIAHYSGLVPLMFPESIDSVEELVSFCRDNGISYIAYTGTELKSRPALKILFSPDFSNPGLEFTVSNNAGVVYRVK